MKMEVLMLLNYRIGSIDFLTSNFNMLISALEQTIDTCYGSYTLVAHFQ